MTAATPSEIGALAEREVAYALGSVGFDIYVPMFMPHSRVDFIAARGVQTIRVQVKSARVMRNAVFFAACSNTGNVPKTYSGEIDAFGVFAPTLGRCYLVPVDHVPTRAGNLRLTPPRNNQQKGIRWARDYLIGPDT